MSRRSSFSLTVLLLGFLVPSIRADHFRIDLKAKVANETKTAHVVTLAANGRPQPRALLKAHVDTPITVSWTLSNATSAPKVKEVVVHFFAVREEKPDQQAVPALTKNVVAESALTMDFMPNDKTEGELTFSVAKPGCYLLRLETIGAVGKDGREPFAALDVVVR